MENYFLPFVEAAGASSADLAVRFDAKRDTPELIDRFLQGRVTDEVLRSMPGSSEAAVNGFKLWQNADTVYTFPTLAEVRQVLGREFCEREVWFPSYALGHSCPTLLLTPR